MTAVAAPSTGRHRAMPARPVARRAAYRTAYRTAQRIVGVLGTLLVVAAAVALLGMTVGPRVLHYRTATMLTGSMVPTINPGDVIVDTQQPASKLAVGQIITYHIPVDDHRVESHRVTWVRVQKDGSVLFRTKGDANNGEDPWTARAAAGSKVWTVRTELPAVGSVIRFLRQPYVQLALTRVLPAVLVVSALLAIWRRKPDESA